MVSKVENGFEHSLPGGGGGTYREQLSDGRYW